MAEQPDKKAGQLPGHALGLGLNIVVAALFFGFLGRLIGRRVGGEEVLTLVGGLMGAAAGFYSLYVHLVVRPREKGEEEESQ